MPTPAHALPPGSLDSPAVPTALPSPDALVGSLDMLGVFFLSDGTLPAEPLPPALPLAGLAAQSEARLHLALVALLLTRPELATYVPQALTYLDPPAQAALHLFYTAARLLQACYRAPLTRHLGAQVPLPDLFGTTLALPTGSVEVQLAAMGDQHAALTGLSANWVGSYHHAARRLLARLEAEARWRNP